MSNFERESLVETGGFEPPTPCLQSRCNDENTGSTNSHDRTEAHDSARGKDAEETQGIKRPWTPGPWHMDSVDTPFFLCDGVCQGGDDSGDRVVFAEDGEPLLATLPKLDGSWFGGRLGMEEEAIHVQQANARLIAAAPDLYEALEALLKAVKTEAPGTGLNNRKYVDLGVQCHAALAKALGGQDA